MYLIQHHRRQFRTFFGRSRSSFNSMQFIPMHPDNWNGQNDMDFGHAVPGCQMAFACPSWEPAVALHQLLQPRQVGRCRIRRRYRIRRLHRIRPSCRSWLSEVIANFDCLFLVQGFLGISFMCISAVPRGTLHVFRIPLESLLKFSVTVASSGPPPVGDRIRWRKSIMR